MTSLSTSSLHSPGTLPLLVPVARLQTDDLLAPLRGPSAAMAQLWSQVKMVAPHFRALLLTGELGCGQESVVHLLQLLSPFHAGPLLILDAGEAGRRLQNAKRLLQSVSGGVLYLPQVERLAPEAQAQLLRFMRLNRHHLCSLIASSAHDLRTLVPTKEFSAALAQELGSLRLAVPSLRDRFGDIPSLADFFLREAQSASLHEQKRSLLLASDFLEKAGQLAWPGNLDQLRAVLQSLAESVAADSENLGSWAANALSAADLERALQQLEIPEPTARDAAPVRLVKLDQVMQEHIRAVLVACEGNKLRASEVLGISRSTLYRMLDSSAPLALLA